jgi:hypothetical protein
MVVIRTAPRPTSRKRRGRAPALVVAAVMTAALLGGCGTDTSQRDLAAQDKLVQLGNRLATAHARVVQARRLVARQRLAAARVERQQARAGRPAVRPVVQSGFSLEELCAPIERSGSQQARQAARRREKQRKRALYYLNLSCPPVRS